MRGKKSGNRRRAPRVHRLVGLFRDADSKKVETAGYHINLLGDLGNHTIVSIPVDMSRATIRSLHRTLSEQLGKPVLIVTHNIEFLATEELPRKEAAEFLLQLGGAAEGQGDHGEGEGEEAPDADSGAGDPGDADPGDGELGPESDPAGAGD